MKVIKKIGISLTLFLFTIYNTCFADIIDEKWINRFGNKSHRMEYQPEGIETKKYVLIGIVVFAIVVCAAIIIRRIMKNKKEKDNDKNNDR